MTTTLGPFALDRVIGKGGMGEVWAARHERHGTPVAIKVLTARLARDERYVVAFRNEVRAVASLDHPSVVRVFDHATIGPDESRASGDALPAGAPYLVMELVDGVSLRARAGRMPWRECRRVLLELLDALAHAHARGVIHRDVKPGNVLLGSGDRVVLTDFGLAHGASEPDDDSDPLPGGTPEYMAPEQAIGRVRDYGPWTDLYALGSLAMSIVGRVSVPARFHEWIAQLLAYDFRQRFAFASDAARALRVLGEPAVVPPQLGPTGLDRRIPLVSARSPTQVTVPVATSGRPPSEPPPPPPPLVTDVQIPERWIADPRSAERPDLTDVGLGLFGLRAVPLVGRDQERDALWAALREVHARRAPRVVLLEGAAGNGKSRLCRWLCERAHELGAARSLRVVHAEERGPTVGLSAALLRHLGGEDLSSERLRVRLRMQVPGLAEDELRALADWLSPDADAGHLATPSERYALLRRQLERETSERPMVLWVDDAQWGADALRFVSRQLDPRPGAGSGTPWPVPLLILITVRDDVLPDRPEEAALLADLRGRPEVDVVVVPPLRAPHRRELLRGLLPLDPELSARVEARTAGNPLFAVQLVGDWVERGALEPGPRGFRLPDATSADLPRDLRDVWEERLSRLLEGRPEGDALALEVAAALGPHVALAEWLTACGHAAVAPSAELRERLLARRLAVAEPGGWAFVHGMLREAVERRAERAGRLPACHAAAARMLVGRTGAGVAERLGRHLVRAGRPRESLAPALAGIVERRLAADFAGMEMLIAERDATCDDLDLPPDAEPRIEHGVEWVHCRRSLGGLEDVEGRVGELAEAAARAGRRDLVAALAVERWSIEDSRGRVGRSWRRLREGERAAEACGDLAQLGRIRRCMGFVLVRRGRREQGEAVLRRAVEAMEASGDRRQLASTLLTLADAEHRAGRTPEAAGHATRALSLSERAGDRVGVANAAVHLGELARASADLEAAERHYRRARELFASLGHRDLVVAELNLGLTCIERASFDEARGIFTAARRRLERSGLDALAALALVCLLPCVAADGDWPGFDALVVEAEERARDTRLADPDAARVLDRAVEIAARAGETARAARARALAEGVRRALGP